MLVALVIAGFVVVAAGTSLVADFAVGVLLIGSVLALLQGDFGTALLGLVIFIVLCVYWSWPRAV